VARESATTYEAAIDRLLDKLERQVERYRDKRTVEKRRSQNGSPAPAADELIELPRDEPAG
jgi:ribosome-associated translation inhibitor RaiA